MHRFTSANTTGYSEAQLSLLNEIYTKTVETLGKSSCNYKQQCDDIAELVLYFGVK